jgi:hypothetical protein
MRFQHRFSVGLGPAGVGAGHGGQQAVPQPGQRLRIGDSTVAFRAADRKLQRRKLAVADALGQHQPRIFGPQFPELAAPVIYAGGATRKHVLQRAGHPLRGAPVDGEGLLDFRQGHTLIARRGHFGQAQQIGGFLKRHERPMTGFATLVPYIGRVDASFTTPTSH